MISEPTTRLLLVRSGGRCAICNRDLFSSAITWKAVPLGERAHIVGRSTSERSPRGTDALSFDERDDVDNLMLLCSTCHDELDHPANLDALTVERLRAIKLAHEDRIEQILSVPPANTTTVLRMQGSIGDAAVHVDRSVAAATVLQAGRYAKFSLSPDRTGMEIDLRRMAASAPANRDYYTSCTRVIDQFFTRQFMPAVEDGNSLSHVSVFALARWPLLVYLGARLGDKIDADIYQRHRTTESWAWPRDGQDNRFEWRLEHEGAEEDVVLVLALSAAVHVSEVPADLRDCAVYRVTPAQNITPHYDIVGTPDALKSAEQALRGVLADIEQDRKTTRNLHILGAAPTSVCTTLGRSITAGIHPHIVLHDRVEGTYRPAMEVN